MKGEGCGDATQRLMCLFMHLLLTPRSLSRPDSDWPCTRRHTKKDLPLLVTSAWPGETRRDEAWGWA